MSRHRFDPIGVIEASYAPTAEPGTWARGILESLASINQGMGFFFRVQRIGPCGEDRGTEMLGTLDLECPPNAIEAMRDGNHLASPEVFRALFAPRPPASSAMWRLRRLSHDPSSHEFHAMMRRLGMDDCFGVIATDVDPRGLTFLLIGIPVRSSLSMPPRTRHQLGRVAAHVASAWRLRELSYDSAKPAEAVLEPSGKLAHAEGAARERSAQESLARAVALVERARGRLRKNDPDEALELWQGLVNGQWSLVDTVESDGRRLVLARRNDPRVRDPKALTERERQVLAYAAVGHSNKYVAYQLGLSPTTVATHLESARRKLGAASRRELIQTYAPGMSSVRPPSSA